MVVSTELILWCCWRAELKLELSLEDDKLESCEREDLKEATDNLLFKELVLDLEFDLDLEDFDLWFLLLNRETFSSVELMVSSFNMTFNKSELI